MSVAWYGGEGVKQVCVFANVGLWVDVMISYVYWYGFCWLFVNVV